MAQRSRDTTAGQAADGTLHRLLALHGEARAQERSLVVVLHTPFGGGFEALIKELRRAAIAERIGLFEGTCQGAGTTWRPLRDILVRWLRTLEDLGLSDDEVQALALPVAHSLGLPVGGLGSTPDAAALGQLHFFESVGNLLTALHHRLPGIVLLQDLQHADGATRAAIHHLLQTVFTDPVARWAPSGWSQERFHGTVVVTCSERDGAVERLRTLLAGREHVHFLSVRSAEEEEFRAYLGTPEVMERLMRASGASLDNLRELFALLPGKVEDLFLRRVERLERAEQRVLEALAVLGLPTQPDLLLRVTDAGDARPSLALLADQRLLVRVVSRGELRVDLPSDESREALYDRIPEERRRLLHGRVAELLEERARLGDPIEQERIAHHYLRSNVQDRAILVGIEAAEQLHISYAHDRARELLEAIVERVSDGADRVRAVERLAEVCAAMNDPEAALSWFGTLLATAPADRRAGFLRRRGELFVERGEFDLALRSFDEADEAAQALPADPDRQRERVRIAASKAEALYGLGDYDRATRIAEEANEHAGPNDVGEGARQAIRLRNTLGKIRMFRGQIEAARDAFGMNRARAATLGFRDEEARALCNLGTIALETHAFDDAERTFSECLVSGGMAIDPLTRAHCQLNLAVLYHKTFRYREAIDAYLRGLATFAQASADLPWAVTAMNLGSLYDALGDTARGRDLLRAAIDVTTRRDIKYVRGRSLFLLAQLELGAGRFEEARLAIEEAEPLLGRTGSSTLADRMHLALARVAHAAGDSARRDALMERVHPTMTSVETREVAAERDLLLGLFRKDDGQPEGALAPLGQALRVFVDDGHREKEWAANLALADAWAAIGDRKAARGYAEAARRRIGELAREVPASLREVYRQQPSRRRAETWEDSPAAPRMPARPVPEAEGVAWRRRYDLIVGQDPRLLQIFRIIDRVSDSDSTALIQGESGTGKELVAEAIHRHSRRAGGPFVKVNCAAFVETLLLSELFGHEKGAFTGAMSRKKGRFELADGGTLFLDEIGDISANTQVALLRVLQERTFERVGGSETVSTNVRLLCATNRNLEEMVRAGTFRLDLYYRLKGVVIELPPLRERRADIPLLVEHFCRQLAREGQQIKHFSREAMRWLARYSWPGNVRELENFVRSMLLFVDGERVELSNVRQFEDFFADGGFVDDSELPPLEAPDERESGDAVTWPPAGSSDGGTRRLASDPSGTQGTAPPKDHRAQPASAAIGVAERSAPVDPEAELARWAIGTGIGLPEARRRLEQELIRQALERTRGNITHAAQLLDMTRPRLSQVIAATPELERFRRELTGER